MREKVLSFQISTKSMEERVLKFTVVDVDRNRRHQTIGYALYPLRDHMYGYDEPIVIWRDLEKEVAEVSDVITCTTTTSRSSSGEISRKRLPR